MQAQLSTSSSAYYNIIIMIVMITQRWYLVAFEDTVFLSPNEEEVFVRMRAKLTRVFLEVQELIIERNIILTALVRFSRLTFDTLLRPKLTLAESIEDALEILLDECTIMNISYLEEVVKFFEIDEASALLQKYKEEVERECNDLPLKMSLDHLFKQGLDHQLKNNTIKFVLNWKPEERKFKDIKSVLWKAFGEAAKNVKVIVAKTTNSIAIICYAPHTMMTYLMMRAKSNIDVLIEEGVMSLFVGYYTVLDHRTPEQVHTILCLKMI